MQENPNKSVFSLQIVVFSCVLLGLTRKLGTFKAKCLQIQSNFPKTRGIWGKMSNILVKWLHYLWLFQNIWGIVVNLLHLCGDFSKNLGNSIQNTYRFTVIMGTKEGTI